jgi:hypothetical protein
MAYLPSCRKEIPPLLSGPSNASSSRLIESAHFADDCLTDCQVQPLRDKLGCRGYQQQHSTGEMMKKHYVRFLMVFFGLAALTATAHGQASDQLVVKIPWEFVVAGKVLPAGTYRVMRVSAVDQSQLVISTFENRVTVFVLAVSSGVNASRDEQPRVSFQQAGDQHFLSKIETAEHKFTIPVSSSAVLQAAMKRQSDPASMSQSTGSN